MTSARVVRIELSRVLEPRFGTFVSVSWNGMVSMLEYVIGTEYRALSDSLGNPGRVRIPCTLDKWTSRARASDRLLYMPQ